MKIASAVLFAILLVANSARAANFPMTALVRDQAGIETPLGRYFGRQPVVVIPVYYRCPNICALTLAHFLDVVNGNGRHDFGLLVYTIDARETSDDAAAFLATAMKDRPPQSEPIHVVTADDPTITALTAALGFFYHWDAAAQEFSHPAALAVLTKDGRVIQRLPGVAYDAGVLSAALDAAAADRPGTLVDRFWATCFHAVRSQAGPLWTIIRVANVTVLVLIAAAITVLLRRRARHHP